jgi:hypothetical protein
MNKFLICVFLFSYSSLFSQNDKIDNLLDSLYSVNKFNGIVSIIDSNSNFIYCKGFANVSTKKLISEDMYIDIASVSKIFFNLMYLEMYKKGKYDIKDKVNYYLNDIPDSTIRIIDLINHSSNISAEMFTDKKLKLLKDNSKEACYRFIINNCFKNINKEKRFEYAPLNYFLLALIAEKIENKPFDTLINNFINSKNYLKNAIYKKEAYYSPNNFICPLIENKIVSEKEHSSIYKSVVLTDNIIGGIGIYLTVRNINLFRKYFFEMLKSDENIIFGNCFEDKEKKHTY